MDLPHDVRALLDASFDAIAVVDRDLVVQYYNQKYLELTGLRPRALVPPRAREMCHEHFGLDTCRNGCLARRAFEAARAINEYETSSTRRVLKLQLLAIPLLNDRGEVYGVVEQYRDITAEARVQEDYRRMLDEERRLREEERLQLEAERGQRTLLEAEISRQAAALNSASAAALTDPLTGVANRRHLDERMAFHLDEAVAKDTTLAIVLFDLDHFKHVNDRLGHAAGDRLLQDFARVLRSSAREGDIVARFGGEEFILLLPGAGATEAAMVAARVQERMRQADFVTTTSGGVACYPCDALDARDLFQIADRVLYAAKNQGRNRICTIANLASNPGPGVGPTGSPHEAGSSVSGP